MDIFYYIMYHIYYIQWRFISGNVQKQSKIPDDW